MSSWGKYRHGRMAEFGGLCRKVERWGRVFPSLTLTDEVRLQIHTAGATTSPPPTGFIVLSPVVCNLEYASMLPKR